MKGVFETNLKEKEEEFTFGRLYEAKTTAGKPNPSFDTDFLKIHIPDVHSEFIQFPDVARFYVQLV